MARKILLADDSVTAQNMGRKILADAGYDVVTVNNGSAALKRISEIKPDLIVLDVYMPGYSGLEVCQRLKDAAGTAHIPVLLTVGKLEPFKPEEARRVKADAHIVKPFEASELLSAITRLEDRMVPQQSEGGRFSTSVSGVERFGGEGNGRPTESKTGTDTGWKSRLGFPSKKKKEETEPEPESEDIAAAATFRDFRKAKGKIGASAPFRVKEAPPPGQEPGLVPDIPRDITPEELDALSALAAKLDGPIPAAENIAPLAEKTGPGVAPAAELAAAKTEAAETEVPKTDVEVPAPAVDVKKEVETPAPVAEAAVEIHQHETERPEAQHPEIPAAVAAVAVNTTPVAQESGPVDKNDEPTFATAASAAGQPAEEKVEARPSEAVAKGEATEASAPAEAVAAKDKGSEPEASEAAEPAPSDEALAEALRLLTPATVNADVSTVPPHGTSDGTVVATGQLLKEEAARNAAAGPRWVAEPVALTMEEAAISLEAEMFSTFAATFAAASGGDVESVGVTGVSAIAAAVENRLAEAELTASAKALSEQGAECSSETTAAAAEPSLVEAPAEAVAVSNAASPVDGIEPEKIEAEKLEADRKGSPDKVAEEAPAEQIAAATFAVAGSKDEVEVAVAAAEENQDSSSDSGGQDSMGKDVKAKSGKSNWHQIHTAPASAAANSDVVEAAKQAAAGAEESPKAMAAAAAAEGSASPSATDASTIASIVDSVMADLRPKIVEEIAKKLAGK